MLRQHNKNYQVNQNKNSNNSLQSTAQEKMQQNVCHYIIISQWCTVAAILKQPHHQPAPDLADLSKIQYSPTVEARCKTG